jgi:flagellar hook-length control protein FliK
MQELNAKVLDAKPRLSDAVALVPLLEVPQSLPASTTERESLASSLLPIPTVESRPATQNEGFQDSDHHEPADETPHAMVQSDTTESLRETARFAQSLPSRTETEQTAAVLPTETQTTQPNDRVQIIEQLRERVENIRLEQGRSETTLHLRPDHLGEVHILLSSGREGVSARIVAENFAVQQALEGAKETLRAALENRGLPLVRFEVGLANGGFAEGRPNPQAFQEPPRSRSRNTASVRALQSATPSNPPLPTPAPSLRDRRSQLDYAA